jgi:hypothetical protein
MYGSNLTSEDVTLKDEEDDVYFKEGDLKLDGSIGKFRDVQDISFE